MKKITTLIFSAIILLNIIAFTYYNLDTNPNTVTTDLLSSDTSGPMWLLANLKANQKTQAAEVKFTLSNSLASLNKPTEISLIKEEENKEIEKEEGKEEITHEIKLTKIEPTESIETNTDSGIGGPDYVEYIPNEKNELKLTEKHIEEEKTTPKPENIEPKIKEKIEYPIHKYIRAVRFYIGEEADHSNDFDDTLSSAWIKNWVKTFGGIDRGSLNRFEANENLYYVALPYNDLDENSERKASAVNIPWNDGTQNSDSLVKDRWVKLTYRDTTCYAQWEDVGPTNTDDFDYVFNNTRPSTLMRNKSGISLSPATWACLGLEDYPVLHWQFIDAEDVPYGRWTRTIT